MTSRPLAKRFRLTRWAPRESAVLAACKDLLAMHPRIAASWRNQSGKAYIVRPIFGVREPYKALKAQLDRCVAAGLLNREQIAWLEFGFEGGSDLLGVMKGRGRAVAVEVKQPGKHPTLPQQTFLDKVNAAGGLGLCVDDVAALHDALNEASRGDAV